MTPTAHDPKPAPATDEEIAGRRRPFHELLGPLWEERLVARIEADRARIEELERQLAGQDPGLIPALRAELAAAREEIAKLRDDARHDKNDLEAYRGALGYSVPGEYGGMLTDGSGEPRNGIAIALDKQRAAEKARADRAEARVKELGITIVKMANEISIDQVIFHLGEEARAILTRQKEESK